MYVCVCVWAFFYQVCPVLNFAASNFCFLSRPTVSWYILCHYQLTCLIPLRLSGGILQSEFWTYPNSGIKLNMQSSNLKLQVVPANVFTQPGMILDFRYDMNSSAPPLFCETWWKQSPGEIAEPSKMVFVSCSSALSTPWQCPCPPLSPLHPGSAPLIKTRKKRLSFIYG